MSHRTPSRSQRRDWVLQGLATAGRWTKLDPEELRAALAEPVVLAGERPIRIPGGHFTWQVRRQLQAILGPDVDLKRAGYRVITTLDWQAQKLAERWVGAAAIAPNISRKKAKAMLDQLKIPASDRSWINALRGKDLHNGALVALDYRTGDVLAYVGSAGYARDDIASEVIRAEIRRGRGWRSPARLGLEADPLRRGVRRQEADARAASCSTSPPSSIAARTGRRATPTSASADRCSSGGPSSTR